MSGELRIPPSLLKVRAERRRNDVHFPPEDLERLLQRRCGLVDHILGRVLRVTCCLLSVALELLCRSLRLHLVRANDVADALLSFADGLIGCTSRLVRIATHDSSWFRGIA